MKSDVMKIALVILLLPIVLIALVVLYQIVGMAVNHHATDVQTKRLQQHLEQAIDDVAIIDVHSETGNIGGTGNHVDCLSRIVFDTDYREDAIKEMIEGYYVIDGWEIRLWQNEDTTYTIERITSAPFSDNIEGH